MEDPQATLQYNKIIYAAGVENERRKRAHAAGKEARHKGYARISPYYEKPALDHFFFGGFDGLTLEQTVAIPVPQRPPSLAEFFGQQLAQAK